MGQFTEQVQKITAQQNEILNERKRKQLKKEQKNFLQYLLNKYKIKILDTIDMNTSPELIGYILTNFEKELKQHDFDKVTTRLKVKELEEFTYREMSKQQTRSKKLEEEQKASFDDIKLQLYASFEETYKKYEARKAFRKLENCKHKILEFLGSYNYKTIEFYDRLNKKFYKKYYKPKKQSVLPFAILGFIIGGIGKGRKKSNHKMRY